MGSKRLDQISDYHRHGYKLRVDCKACGRVVLLNPLPIIELCQERGWSRQMQVVDRRLRCSKCGSKDKRTGPALGL